MLALAFACTRVKGKWKTLPPGYQFSAIVVIIASLPATCSIAAAAAAPHPVAASTAVGQQADSDRSSERRYARRREREKDA